MDENDDNWGINLSFQTLLICFARFWTQHLQGEKRCCQTDYTGNIFYFTTAEHQPSASEGVR
jgi:hypothetical protein